jgi:predicted RNase H-like HicB family nuclease
MTYTAVILKSGDWYAGFIKELPGANSQGKTIEELIENLKEAIQLVIESNIKHTLEVIKNTNYEEKLIVI